MDLGAKVQELKGLIEGHRSFRRDCLNLIASENRPSPFVEGFMAEDLNRRYAYYLGLDPKDQSYQGSGFVAGMEALAQEMARELFGAKYVELRALSGNIAGIISMFALGSPGDTVLEVQNAHQYAKKMAVSGLKVSLNPIAVPWDGPRYNVDLDATVNLIEKHCPKLVVLGSAMFLFPQPVREIKEAMERFCPGSILIYDAAHVMGLIAGGRFQSPLEEGADVVITSTHKTLAGPQGGMILTNDRSIAEKIAEATSPLMIANYHLARMPALAATFMEWMTCGSAYADAIIANAKALGKALEAHGVPCVGQDLGFTESHTILPVVDAFGEGQKMADRLEACHMIVGATDIPEEVGSHGLRVGVQEVTRYGMVEADAGELAACLVDGMAGNPGARNRAIALADRFRQVKFTVDESAL